MIGRLWTVTLLACQLISASEFPTTPVVFTTPWKKSLRVASHHTMHVGFMCTAQTLSGGFIVSHRLILLNSLYMIATDVDIGV